MDYELLQYDMDLLINEVSLMNLLMDELIRPDSEQLAQDQVEHLLLF